MAIIINKKGEPSRKLEPVKFSNEDSLQAYIKEHPEVIPIDEIKEKNKIFIAAREFPTNSGPIDALGFDKEGNIYIIETKLYKNPDKRRVIAQVLDYGAALWNHSNNYDKFQSDLDSYTQKNFNLSFAEKILEFFEFDEEQLNEFLDNTKHSLSEADYKFLVVMDELDDRLKELILFLNTNSQFDLYSVSLEYYKVAEYEIIIPSLFGNEVKKEVSSSRSKTTERKFWNKDIFFEEARRNLSEDAVSKLEMLYRFGEDENLEPSFGTGNTGSFSFKITGLDGNKVSIFHARTDRMLEVISWYWKTFEETDVIIDRFLERITRETGINMHGNQNATDLDDVSEEQLTKLFEIYSDSRNEIEKLTLTQKKVEKK